MNNFQNATITSIFRFVFGKTPAGKSHDFQKAPLKCSLVHTKTQCWCFRILSVWKIGLTVRTKLRFLSPSVEVLGLCSGQQINMWFIIKITSCLLFYCFMNSERELYPESSSAPAGAFIRRIRQRWTSGGRKKCEGLGRSQSCQDCQHCK